LHHNLPEGEIVLMRRLMTVLVLALVVLAALPVVSFAQDEAPAFAWEFDKDTYVDLTDGFRFYYPVDWVVDTSKGVVIGQTQEDVDASNDGDPATYGSGMVINVGLVPMEAFADLGEEATLDDIANFIVEQSGITEKSRAESSVMARRAISIIGTNAQERDGIATIWKQDGAIGVASLGLPEEVGVDDVATTWVATLLSISPIDAPLLAADVLTDSAAGFTINYPDGWTADPQQAGKYYEVADDVSAEAADRTGSSITVTDAAPADLGLADDATLEDVVEFIKASATLGDDATTEEFVFLGQPATLVTGTPAEDGPGAGYGVIAVASLVDGHIILIGVGSPSPEAAADLMPTLTQVLRSAKPIATE
jgi:hypothetical protein